MSSRLPKTQITLARHERFVFSSDRRDSTEIAYDLLTLVKRGASKNQIIHDANLSFRLATRYTTQLAEMGLIHSDEGGKSMGQYRLTAKGEKVLKILYQLETKLKLSNSDARIKPTRVIPFEAGGMEKSWGLIGARRIWNWGDKLKSLIGYVLVVLAGIGLGYLLP